MCVQQSLHEIYIDYCPQCLTYANTPQILGFDGQPGEVPGEFHIIDKLPPSHPVPLHIHFLPPGDANFRREVLRLHTQKSLRHVPTVLPNSFSGQKNLNGKLFSKLLLWGEVARKWKLTKGLEICFIFRVDPSALRLCFTNSRNRREICFKKCCFPGNCIISYNFSLQILSLWGKFESH